MSAKHALLWLWGVLPVAKTRLLLPACSECKGAAVGGPRKAAVPAAVRGAAVPAAGAADGAGVPGLREKQCMHCLLVRPVAQFRRSKNKGDRLHNRCKVGGCVGERCLDGEELVWTEGFLSLCHNLQFRSAASVAADQPPFPVVLAASLHVRTARRLWGVAPSGTAQARCRSRSAPWRSPLHVVLWGGEAGCLSHWG